MTSEKAKQELTHFIDTVVSDIQLLKQLADKKAEEEYHELLSQGGIIMPTTVREGPPDNPHTYLRARCTVPLTMACFAAIDFIGSVLIFSGGLKETSEKGRFYIHAKKFFNQLLNRSDIDRESRKDLLQKTYRNGMMHGYLPIGSIQMGYSVSYSGLLDENILFHDLRKETILNVKSLSSLTLQGLEQFRLLVNNDENLAALRDGYVAYLDKNLED